MKLVGRIAAVVSAVALSATASVAVSSQAQADSLCPEGYMCMYEKADYGGGRYVLPRAADGAPCDKDFRGKKFDNGNALDNHVSSFRNLTPWAVLLSTGPGTSSPVQYMVSQRQQAPRLDPLPAQGSLIPAIYLDDFISSACS
ncbi:peptidase inhibitor family I36 protein [Kineosporia sp. NBRC 101731]|uniref:peptidase inhibitor family I36 protein n=1 Tax=Kineosporia sp. NBRC 101731 TaxID=3032199 RepID=UPI0024A16BD0|nr:peptidase inhibitor family I36 protein [Kineosporia sp. NBRC 101731]GLY28866.1 hypothetical protein Kisp02_22310 [Kineosporia sp. NBRC 101731]